jgi:hypothetical protein
MTAQACVVKILLCRIRVSRRDHECHISAILINYAREIEQAGQLAPSDEQTVSLEQKSSTLSVNDFPNGCTSTVYCVHEGSLGEIWKVHVTSGTRSNHRN